MLLHTVKVWDFLPQTLWVLGEYLEDGSVFTCHTLILFPPDMWAIGHFFTRERFKKRKKKDLKLPRPQSTGKFLALCCLLPSSFSSGPTEAALSRWYQPLPVQDAVCAKSRAGFSGPHGWSAHRCGIGSPLALQPAQRFEMMKSLVTLPQQLNIPFRKCSSDRQWCVMLLCVMLLFKSFTSLMC